MNLPEGVCRPPYPSILGAAKANGETGSLRRTVREKAEKKNRGSGSQREAATRRERHPATTSKADG
jgi:hypothetical protein